MMLIQCMNKETSTPVNSTSTMSHLCDSLSGYIWEGPEWQTTLSSIESLRVDQCVFFLAYVRARWSLETGGAIWTILYSDVDHKMVQNTNEQRKGQALTAYVIAQSHPITICSTSSFLFGRSFWFAPPPPRTRILPQKSRTKSVLAFAFHRAKTRSYLPLHNLIFAPMMLFMSLNA